MMKSKKDMNGLSEALSRAGVNPTAQRLVIFQYVYNESDHPTPEQVKMAVDQVFPKISLATIYNTLNTLVDAGLVRAVKLPHSGKVVYDANTSKHYHFIDEHQGAIIDVSPDQIQVSVNLPDGLIVNDVDIFITGEYRSSSSS